MLPGIVLAAGHSTRMGSPKALLPGPDGRRFVTRIVHTLREAGIVELVVVTGRDHDAIVETLTRDMTRPPQILRNHDPSRGQLSSLWVAMDAVVRPDTEGILVTLVDVPMVLVSTVTRVVTEWQRSRAPIVRPAIGDRHGHPVIFDRSVIGALRAAPIDAGAKTVVRAHEHDLLNVPVDDEGCMVDLDTPEDYRRLQHSHEPRSRGGTEH
jgi:CTP:molybdopterin cytidylyltransferase MocA